MRSPCTDLSPTARRRRGMISAEFGLVLIVLLFFLLMAPAVWKIWAAEHHTRAQAHRDTFARTATFYNLPPIPGWVPGLGGGRTPKSARIPRLRPNPPNNLRRYRNFANTTNEGRHRETIRYSSGWEGFRGEVTFQRRAYVIRPTWTWSGYPFVPTQDLSERNKIRRWYKDAYEATFTNSRVNALKVDKAPL